MQSRSNALRNSFRVLVLVCLAGCGGGGGGSQSQSTSQSSQGLGAPSTTVPAPVAGVSGLPINGARAVPTFQSIGIYWSPPSNPGSAGCSVIFRRAGDTSFREGLNLWYDSSNGECRGSLVQLVPGTTYEVQLGMPGQSPSAGFSVSTWSENFAVARTVTLAPGTRSTPLVITEGGTPSGYVVYQADSAGTTIDVQNSYRNNITVSAPYVIVRGFTLKGAQADAIDLKNGAHDVVIDSNDISGWGRFRSSGSWDYGVDYDAGVRCESVSSLERVIIQRNRIHDPRYGANSWDSAHPAGPQGISFNFCGGNHVMRYNEITSSDSTHYYNDGIGGSDNYTRTGFPNYDSDIHGNIIQGVMDDGIEAEGGNRNVRIWGNYLDQTGTGIASTVDSVGPLYIFRNVYNRSRMRYQSSLDSDDRGPFFKSGSDSSVGNGRRYVFHNTSLQPTQSGATNGLGAGAGLQGTGSNPLTNTISRNNVYWIWKSSWSSVDDRGGSGNDVNYDLYNGSISAGSGAESNGVRATPTFASGSGVGMSGMYQLAPGSAGFGTGARIPNFNDDVGAPDMGAHQSGKSAMVFGINAGL